MVASLFWLISQHTEMEQHLQDKLKILGLNETIRDSRIKCTFKFIDSYSLLSHNSKEVENSTHVWNDSMKFVF